MRRHNRSPKYSRFIRLLTLRLAVALPTLALVACGGGDSSDTGTSPTATPPASSTPIVTTTAVRAEDTPLVTSTPAPLITASPPPSATVVTRPAGAVSRAEFGDKWPLSVESGEMRCVNRTAPGYGQVVFISGGVTYAINGTARTAAAKNGWVDLSTSPIWLNNPSIPGAKIDISPLLNRGLALC